MQSGWPGVIRRVFSEETAFTLSIAILVIGVFLALFVWRWTHSILNRTGVTNAVEGTAFERSLNSWGTSTTGFIAQLTALFVYLGCVIVALHISRLLEVDMFWERLTSYFPRIFIALLAIIVGIIAGEKAKLVIDERLRSVKLPEVALLSELVKYSIFYIAALISLSQIGVATGALLVLLGAYVFGIVVFGAVALKDLLAAGSAGLYILLVEPYSIGDEVRIDETRGIVQEIDMFVTYIEADGEEYIIPNQIVFRTGVIRIRE